VQPTQTVLILHCLVFPLFCAWTAPPPHTHAHACAHTRADARRHKYLNHLIKTNNTNPCITSKKYEPNSLSTDTILTKIKLWLKKLKEWHKTYIQWNEYCWCNGIQQRFQDILLTVSASMRNLKRSITIITATAKTTTTTMMMMIIIIMLQTARFLKTEVQRETRKTKDNIAEKTRERWQRKRMHGQLPCNKDGKLVDTEQSLSLAKIWWNQERNRKYNSGNSRPSN